MPVPNRQVDEPREAHRDHRPDFDSYPNQVRSHDEGQVEEPEDTAPVAERAEAMLEGGMDIDSVAVVGALKRISFQNAVC